MPYTVTLTERFNATHALPELCEEPTHGHNWLIKATLVVDNLAPPGVIQNYYEIKSILEKSLPIDQNMNDLYEFAPTIENLSRHFYELLKPQIPQLDSVTVGEFDEFICTYKPSDTF